MAVTPTSAAPRQTFQSTFDPAVVEPLPLDLCPFQAGSNDETARLLAQRLVRRVIADVLVATDAPDSREIRAAATGLLIPSENRFAGGWVVGFGSAAWLHTGSGSTSGGRLNSPSSQPAEVLQVIIPPGRRRPRSPAVKGRQVTLNPDHVMFLCGIAVTNPTRTAADVARDLPPAEALPALHRLGELSGVRPHDVITLLSTMRYARGAACGRQLIGQWAEEL